MMADGLTFATANRSTSVTQMNVEIVPGTAAACSYCSTVVLVEWLIAVSMVVTLVTLGKCDYYKCTLPSSFHTFPLSSLRDG